MTTRKPKTHPAPAPLPDPGERTRARAAEAAERNAKRADRPQILAETKPGKVKVRSLGPSHSDHPGWQETMLDAFGTTSLDFMSSELKRLDSVHRNGNEPYSNKQDLNAALAAIAGAKPENEIESMLVAQMATTHALAMRELGLARRAEFQAQHDAHGSLGVKLLRTFTMQAEALSKLKRGGEQTVRVEHVHVYDGGQAIVGTVTRGGGDDERRRQSHGTIDARALAFAPGSSLSGQDAIRDAMPETRREGKETVQASRRRGRDRRTQG